MSSTVYGHYYMYRGPVKEFDRIVDNKFICGTNARTPEKALNNLAYSFKKMTGRVANSKITLDKAYLTKIGDVT